MKLNGIDFLEVLDQDAKKIGSLRQQTLLVHCLKQIPSTLTSEKVRIEGGVRVSVNALWAFPATTIPATLVTPQEQNFFSTLPDATNVLVVRTDSTGDFSTYKLSLVTSPTDSTPPDGFDPQLSEVEFSFKVECSNDFDCKQVSVCPPEKLSEPEIDYLAKDYASFRRLMFDRLSIVAPDWKERNPADLGVAVVEVLAYVADQLSYYQDAVATEAYLGTGRRRISMRRHARLLDYFVHNGINARAWVRFEVTQGSLADGQVLPARTQLLTRFDAPLVGVRSNLVDAALSQGSEVFETMHDLGLRSAHNEMHFYTWSDEQCCLPKGATQATLKNPENQMNLNIGDVLIFEEILAPDGQPGDPTHRHAVRLIRATPATDPLSNTSVVEIEWQAGDALPFPMCLSGLIAGQNTELCIAHGNVVLVDHGRAVGPETLPEVQTDVPYRPILMEPGLTHWQNYDDSQAKTKPAAMATVQDLRASVPWLKLQVDTDAWTVRQDLLKSDRFAKDFVVEMESDGVAHLRFGDGVFGRPPPTGSTFTDTYRVGNGRAGNVGAEAIAHVVTDLKGITKVLNPLPAQGGIDPEPLEQVRLDVPVAFRVQERAVTKADYAEVSGRHPEVQKALGTLRWTGSWYTMFVTVDRKGGKLVDADFKAELRDFLEKFRLAGHDVEIESPIFVPLDIALTVCVAPSYFRDHVKAALFETFSNKDLPDGRRGFFHPDNFTFEQPVYLSQVIAAAMQVLGVVWVDADETPPKRNRFHRWGELPSGEVTAGLIPMGRLEIARLDNDSNAPENGKIEFYMEGGL